MTNIQQEQPGGIFIPFADLLKQQGDKLDDILRELREQDKNKLDRSVFESFRSMYEERHERLAGRADALERTLENRPQLIKEFRAAQDTIQVLEEDKVSRDAVKAQNRYYLAGGGIVGVAVAVDLVLRLISLATGHGP